MISKLASIFVRQVNPLRWIFIKLLISIHEVFGFSVGYVSNVSDNDWYVKDNEIKIYMSEMIFI